MKPSSHILIIILFWFLNFSYSVNCKIEAVDKSLVRVDCGSTKGVKKYDRVEKITNGKVTAKADVVMVKRKKSVIKVQEGTFRVNDRVTIQKYKNRFDAASISKKTSSKATMATIDKESFQKAGIYGKIRINNIPGYVKIFVTNKDQSKLYNYTYIDRNKYGSYSIPGLPGNENICIYVFPALIDRYIGFTQLKLKVNEYRKQDLNVNISFTDPGMIAGDKSHAAGGFAALASMFTRLIKVITNSMDVDENKKLLERLNELNEKNVAAASKTGGELKIVKNREKTRLVKEGILNKIYFEKKRIIRNYNNYLSKYISGPDCGSEGSDAIIKYDGQKKIKYIHLLCFGHIDIYRYTFFLKEGYPIYFSEKIETPNANGYTKYVLGLKEKYDEKKTKYSFEEFYFDQNKILVWDFTKPVGYLMGEKKREILEMYNDLKTIFVNSFKESKLNISNNYNKKQSDTQKLRQLKRYSDGTQICYGEGYYSLFHLLDCTKLYLKDQDQALSKYLFMDSKFAFVSPATGIYDQVEIKSVSDLIRKEKKLKSINKILNTININSLQEGKIPKYSCDQAGWDKIGVFYIKGKFSFKNYLKPSDLSKIPQKFRESNYLVRFANKGSSGIDVHIKKNKRNYKINAIHVLEHCSL